MNPLKELIKKIAIGGVIVFSMDYLIGEGLRFLYFRHAQGNRRNLYVAMEKTTAPILIFGSSRAQHHYVPDEFMSVFKRECFNTGVDGASLYYSAALQEAVLKRFNPEIMILDINNDEFVASEGQFSALSRLLPYYRHHEEIRPFIKLRGANEKIWLCSHIYPFNSEIIQQIYWNILPGNEVTNRIGEDGYVPLHNILTSPIENAPLNDEKSEIDLRSVRVFKKFIKNCLEKKIRLFVIVSPIYRKNQIRSRTVNLAESICENSNVPLIDLSVLPKALEKNEYFQDISHLNDKGARIFSRIVIEKILGYKADCDG